MFTDVARKQHNEYATKEEIINQFDTFRFYIYNEKAFRFCQVLVQLYSFKRDVFHQRFASFASISRLIHASYVLLFCQKNLDESIVH